MDIHIPIMDGRVATRTIRTEFGASAYFSIIGLTSYVLASERAAFLTNGMDAVISKPVTRYALATFIHKVTSMETSKPVD
jgi:CheY-like chemotaxis protein|tara:strand:+ start:386 stop:625 length:240 start_codon:yes stop_codon:yes gene_type:complete